jgi:hypothetical protein
MLSTRNAPADGLKPFGLPNFAGRPAKPTCYYKQFNANPAVPANADLASSGERRPFGTLKDEKLNAGARAQAAGGETPAACGCGQNHKTHLYKVLRGPCPTELVPALPAKAEAV